MHELIGGLTGTEVVADDFVVAGFGDTYEEAVCVCVTTKALPLFYSGVPSEESSLQWRNFNCA